MLSNILRNSSSIVFNPTSLFQYASKGIPNFHETMFDAKTELDTCLKRACQDLINSTGLYLTSSIQYFLDRCTSFLSTPSTSTSTGDSSGRDLSSQEWATPEKVIELHELFQSSLEKQVLEVSEKMRLYLEEEKTVKVLLPPLLVSDPTSFVPLSLSLSRNSIR